MKRRKLSPVFPIDPAAWMILLTHHHSDLISDEGKALKESPIAFDPSETKPRLVSSSSPPLNLFSSNIPSLCEHSSLTLKVFFLQHFLLCLYFFLVAQPLSTPSV